MVYKTPGEIELMDEANRIVHRVLDGIGERVAPGVTTSELDVFAETTIREAGAVPAFLDYKGYPATICASRNDVIVHGIPNDEPLGEGDIVGIDCGVIYKGYFGDADYNAIRDSWIEQVQVDGRLSDIGAAVQRHVEGNDFSVVREFVGHGIGTSLHEDPQVPNFGMPGHGPRLKPGLVLAIEPMVNAGSPGVRVDRDGWTARTDDGSLSAHFEYSVALTPAGPKVLGVESANV